MSVLLLETFKTLLFHRNSISAFDCVSVFIHLCFCFVVFALKNTHVPCRGTFCVMADCTSVAIGSAFMPTSSAGRQLCVLNRYSYDTTLTIRSHPIHRDILSLLLVFAPLRDDDFKLSSYHCHCSSYERFLLNKLAHQAKQSWKRNKQVSNNRRVLLNIYST